MKKVLMVSCDGLGNGGIQHVMMDIIRGLSNNFHFDMLLFTKDIRYFDSEFQKYGTIFRLPHYEGQNKLLEKIDRYIRFIRIYKGVKKILKENGPYEVIHCNNFFEAAPCLMAATHCEVPIRISHCHSNFLKSHIIAELYKFMMRKLINIYGTVFIGCSQKATNYLFGSKNLKAYSIPNAIDLNKFDISKYPEQKIKHSFIHVGRLCSLKNQLFVLDIFSIIQKKWMDAMLVLVGQDFDNYKQQIVKKIKQLDLRNIKFLQHDSNISNLFAQSEYMIFPSLFEGFGIALVEAQAMNVKCFASDIIPNESNIGLCRYISLNKTAEHWANEILKAEKESLNKTDFSKIDLSDYIKKIKNIYDGNK